MKPLSPIALVSCFAVLVSAQSSWATPSDDPGASAEELLADVVARLPRDPLSISGGITVRKWRGVVLRELKFRMSLDWGSRPAVARYTIQDAFGTELEQLTVTRAEGQEPRFDYAEGNPLSPSATPRLFDAIQDTDLSWIDLTFSFLWWPGGTITGTDEVRGRPCYVVEVPAPAGSSVESAHGSDDHASPYSRVVLWIDEKIHMLLKAEGFDASGARVRRLWVKSFKKVNDRWMIKDLEIQGTPAIRRTKLRIREVDSITHYDGASGH